MRSIHILLISGAFVLAATFAARLFINELTPTDLPHYGKVTEFMLSDQHRKEFGLKDLKNKIWAANFFFTSCPSVCPTINAKVAELARRFNGYRDVDFVSITVDPETDKPEVLTEYGSRYGAEKLQWHFLTGDIETIDQLSYAGFKLGNGGQASLHTTRLVLVDQNGEIRGYYDALERGSMGKLERDIRSLLSVR